MINQFKAARQRYGLSQRRLAVLANIPRRTIESWESGDRECPEYVLRLLIYWLDHEFGHPQKLDDNPDRDAAIQALAAKYSDTEYELFRAEIAGDEWMEGLINADADAYLRRLWEEARK
jgi:transcriptional regulator with XRE-family HTH domain